MANYFEQFDKQDEPAAKENYFAQFDEPEVAEPLTAEASLTEPVPTPEIVTEVPEPIQEKTPEQLAEDVPSPYKRPDGTPYPEARAYEPTIFDSVKDFFTGGEAHKARASNELTARKIAKEQGISVEEVYKSVGGAQPMLNPEGRAPIRALGEGLSIVGEQFASWDIPKGVANTVLRTIRGGDVDVDDENWIDQAIKDTDKPVDLDADPNYKPFKGLGKNLGYSLTTMTAGITAYVAGSMATTPVGGVIASGLASSAVAFRGSKDEYLSRAKEAMDAYYTQLHGRKMNQNEWDAVYDDYNTLANKYGAWEAIPEAIGNMVFIRAFAKPLRGASMGKIGAFKDKAVEIAGRTASVLATENITEIATAMGQNVAELEGGLTERELSLPEAIRETVIPTTLLTAIMGGAGGVIKTAYDKLPSKKPKFDQSDAAPELFTPTHKAGGGQDVQIVTKNGEIVPDTYIDAEGNVFRDSNAVATSPDSGDVSMDVNAVAGSIKAEVFGKEAEKPAGIDEAIQEISKPSIGITDPFGTRDPLTELVTPPVTPELETTSEDEKRGTPQAMDEVSPVTPSLDDRRLTGVHGRVEERRADIDHRRELAAMSEEEKHAEIEVLRKERVTDKLTGINNQTAYQESERLPHQVFMDVDDFKNVNDRLTYEGADLVLKEMGKILKEESDNLGIPARLHGDEFVIESDNPQHAEWVAKGVQERLANTEITFTLPDGTTVVEKGIGVSYGIADTLENAEAQLKKDKAARKAAGLREGVRRDTGDVLEAPTERKQDYISEGAAEAEPLEFEAPVAAPATPPKKYHKTVDKRFGEFVTAVDDLGSQLVEGGGIALIPDPKFKAGESDKPGEIPQIRTKSQNPSWFQSLASEEKATVAQIRNAIDAAKSGKFLGKKQQRIVTAMIDEIAAREERQAEPGVIESAEAAKPKKLKPAGVNLRSNKRIYSPNSLLDIAEKDDLIGEEYKFDVIDFLPQDQNLFTGKEIDTALRKARSETRANNREDTIALIKKSLAAGDMPIFKQANIMYGIHPSSRNKDMYQVTHFTKTGVVGDSQVKTIDEAVTHLQLKKSQALPKAEAEKELSKIMKAEAEYQKRLEPVSKKKVEPEAKVEPKQEVKPTPKPAEKIEDVGEKIGGARKDVWSGFRESIDTKISDEEILRLPLSKLYPEPNYQKLAEQGADPLALATIKVMRDEIPPKGRSGYKQTQYVRQVKVFQNVARAMLDTTLSAKNTVEKMREFGMLKALAERVDLMLELGFPAKPANLKGIKFAEVHFSLYKGEENVNKWIVDITSKSRKSLGGMGGTIAATDTREEAVTALKNYLEAEAAKPKTKKGATKFIIYQYRNMKTRGWIIGKKIGRNYYDMKEGFENQIKAAEFLSENQDSLEAQLKKYKEIPAHRKPVDEARLGEDYRAGKDVTAEEFKDTFGFRGVEFGNWVEQKKRQQDVNEAFDGLMDLAKILGIPPKAISLNGELGMAFGARGAGGIDPAKAHYEPGKVVINLTKKSGSGSLAHEFFHSLDNYFSRIRGDAQSYITDRPFALMDKSVRQEMLDRFKGIVTSIKATGLPKRAAVLDGKKAKDYWGTNIEMAARSFESYVIGKLKDAGLSNDYLANVVSEEYWKAAEALGLEGESSYPYLLEEEMQPVTEAYDALFDAIKTKETEQGTALYSQRPANIGMSGNELTTGDFVQRDTPIESKPKKNIGADRLTKLVNTIHRDNPGTRNITFHVIPTQAEAFGPNSVAENGIIKGGFYAGTNEIVLVAENIKDIADAFTVIRHEAVGHYGLRQLLNEEGQYDKLLQRVYNARSDELKAQYDWVAKAYPELVAQNDVRKIADEMLAHAAETKTESNLLTKIYDAIIKLLNKLGLVLDAVSHKEVNALIRLSEANLRKDIRSTVTSMQQPTYRADDVAPDMFYSQLEEHLAAKLPKSGTPKQFKDTIAAFARKGQIKAEELEWSGVNEWLDNLPEKAEDKAPEGTGLEDLFFGRYTEEKGKITKLTKNDVIDFIRANRIKVDEVVKGENAYSQWEKYADKVNTAINQNLPREEIDRLRDIRDDYRDQATGEGEQTKFAQWQLPGGEKYRELLLTLPVRADASRGWQDYRDEMIITNGVSARAADEVRRYLLGAPTESIDMSSVDDVRERMGDDFFNRYKNTLLDKATTKISEATYKSGHYEEPNVLAHIRFNERTDADGKRVLFVEEIQSDWGQQLRKDKKAIADQVDRNFSGIVKMMEDAGVLKVVC